MHKEIIISIIIIFVIILGNIVTQNHTRQNTDEITTELLSLKENLTQENPSKNQTSEKISEINNKWEEMYHTLAYYIEHDELEKVQTELTSLKANIEVEEYKQAVPDLEKCIFILHHIKEKEALNVRNIF